jgi:hypothetical protein
VHLHHEVKCPQGRRRTAMQASRGSRHSRRQGVWKNALTRMCPFVADGKDATKQLPPSDH